MKKYSDKGGRPFREDEKQEDMRKLSILCVILILSFAAVGCFTDDSSDGNSESKILSENVSVTETSEESGAENSESSDGVSEGSDLKESETGKESESVSASESPKDDETAESGGEINSSDESSEKWTGVHKPK